MNLSKALRFPWRLLRDTAAGFWQEKTWRNAAAIAFYMLFTVGPMLALTLHAAGFLTGDDQGREAIIEWVSMAAGEEGAEAVGEFLENFSLPKSGYLSYAIGAFMLFSGGINAVAHLRETINGILDAEAEGEGDRAGWFSWLVDAAFVASTVFLILASGLIGTVFQYLRSSIESEVPFLFSLLQLAGLALSVLLLVLAMGGIYRYLPKRKLSWKAIGSGALLTAPLFLAERFLMLKWVTNTDLQSVYGSISFMVVFLLWAYVSAQVVLFGAAFAAATEEHAASD